MSLFYKIVGYPLSEFERHYSFQINFKPSFLWKVVCLMQDHQCMIRNRSPKFYKKEMRKE
jgi:hypothetical protein